MKLVFNPLTGLFDAIGSGGGGSGPIASVSDTATIDLTITALDLTADIVLDSIDNSMINSAAAISLSKLATSYANTFAGFDSSGILSTIPQWSFNPIHFGASANWNLTPADGENWNFNQFQGQMDLSADSTNNMDLFSFNTVINTNGFDSNPSGGNVGNLSLSLFHNGAGTFADYHVLQSYGNIGNTGEVIVGQNLRGSNLGLNLGDAVDVNGVVGYQWYFSAPAGSEVGFYTAFQDSPSIDLITSNYNGLNLNPQINQANAYVNGVTVGGNIQNVGSTFNFNGYEIFTNLVTVDGNYNGYGASSQIATANGGVTGYRFSPQITTMGPSSYIQGFQSNIQITNDAASTNLSVFDSNTTTGDLNGYQGLNVYGTMGVVGNVNGFQFTPNFGEATNFNGVNIGGNFTQTTNWNGLNVNPNISASVNTPAGLNIYMGNSVAGSKTVQLNQGGFEANEVQMNWSLTVPQMNSIGIMIGQNTFEMFAPSTPASGTDYLLHNHSSALDFTAASFTGGGFGLGIAAHAFTGNMASAGTETVSSITEILSASIIAATSTGGTFQSVNGFRAVLVNIGGTATIDNYKAFSFDQPIGPVTTGVTYSLYMGEDTENWLAKRLKIGGTDAALAAGIALSVEDGDTLVENLVVADGSNIVLDSTTGTQIATAATQKLGFFGTTPVVQQTGGAATAGGTYGATEQGMIQRMYDALRNLGLLD